MKKNEISLREGLCHSVKRQLNSILLTSLASAVWIDFCIVTFIGFDGELSWVAIALFGLFVYASVMLWKTIFDRRIAPLEIMFWLFHTNFLLLPALSQSIHRSFYWSSYSAYQQESLLYACLIILVGLFAFKIGARLGRREKGSVTCGGAGVKLLNRPLEVRWGVYIALVSILIGLMSLVSVLGLDFFLSSRTSKLGQVESLPELGLLLNLPRALAIGVLLFSIALLIQRRSQRRNIPFSILLIVVAALAVNAIINFPLAVARFWFFGFLISLIWVVSPLRNTMWRGVFVIGMTMLQFTVFPYYSQITRGKGAVAFNIDSIRQYLHHGDFDGFQSIVNTTLYIQDSGFELGRNLISVALFFVPRAIWNKAEPLGTAAADFMGYVYTNLSAPIYAEFYADFGLLSLVLGMGIIGFVMSLCDGYYDHMIRTKRFGVGVLITGVLAGYLIILLRGSLLGVIPSIATLFGVLIILSWLSTRLPGRHSYQSYIVTTKS